MDENENTLEASVIENDKDSGKEAEVVVEAEKDENDAAETSTGGRSKEDEEFVENVKPVEAPAEEKKTESETVGEASVRTSVEASSSGSKVAQGLLAKKKIVKRVKKLVKKKSLKGDAIKVAGEENVTVKQIAEPSSLGESEKEKTVMESVEGNNKESETPLGGNVMEAEKAMEGKRRRKKRQRKQVLGNSNKKLRKDEATAAVAADVTEQGMEEKKEKLVEPDNKREQIGGLIFMCNAKTRPDCFRFSVMGVQEKRKDYVMSIKPGLKLFLYDYDLKLLYGIFQASSAGGMKLERNAFGGSFPAQVRFKVVSECIPLPESQFKKAIKENYNNKNKFKTELTHKQVFKLKKLFRPATLPAQLTHTLPIPVPRDVDRKRPVNDRYTAGSSSSRGHQTHRHERSRKAAPSTPTLRREEPPPHGLYLSEREYRTYGLRRGETSQLHYPIPPPDSSYRDRVPLDSYHPSVDRDRLLRHAEIERHHDRREVVRSGLHLPERDYHPYGREILARNSPDPLDLYRRDAYYSYEYRGPPERTVPRTYLVSPRREEDDDLYSRYVTADSLADYYRSSSRRYPSIAESELPPSSAISRYAYSGSLPYSHR